MFSTYRNNNFCLRELFNCYFFRLLNLKTTINMMNYRKGRNVEEELTRNDIQIENLPEDFLWMHVNLNIFPYLAIKVHLNMMIFVCFRWKVEQLYRMLLNLQRKHSNRVNIVQLYGLDMAEALEKQYHALKYWRETLHYTKLRGYAIKRKLRSNNLKKKKLLWKRKKLNSNSWLKTTKEIMIICHSGSANLEWNFTKYYVFCCVFKIQKWRVLGSIAWWSWADCGKTKYTLCSHFNVVRWNRPKNTRVSDIHYCIKFLHEKKKSHKIYKFNWTFFFLLYLFRYQFSKNRTTFWVESQQSRSSNGNRREPHGNQLRDSNESTSNRNQNKSKKPNRKPKANSNQMDIVWYIYLRLIKHCWIYFLRWIKKNGSFPKTFNKMQKKNNFISCVTFYFLL